MSMVVSKRLTRGSRVCRGVRGWNCRKTKLTHKLCFGATISFHKKCSDIVPKFRGVCFVGPNKSRKIPALVSGLWLFKNSCGVAQQETISENPKGREGDGTKSLQLRTVYAFSAIDKNVIKQHKSGSEKGSFGKGVFSEKSSSEVRT